MKYNEFDLNTFPLGKKLQTVDGSETYEKKKHGWNGWWAEPKGRFSGVAWLSRLDLVPVVEAEVAK